MRIYHDLDSGVILQNEGFARQHNLQNPITMKRGDTSSIEIGFVRGLSGRELLPAGSIVTVGMKEQGRFEGEFIVSGSTSIAPDDESGFYSVEINLNTIELNTLLARDGDDSNDIESVLLMLEISIYNNGSITSSNTSFARIDNDVISGNEGVPETATPAFPPPASINQAITDTNLNTAEILNLTAETDNNTADISNLITSVGNNTNEIVTINQAIDSIIGTNFDSISQLETAFPASGIDEFTLSRVINDPSFGIVDVVCVDLGSGKTWLPYPTDLMDASTYGWGTHTSFTALSVTNASFANSAVDYTPAGLTAIQRDKIFKLYPFVSGRLSAFSATASGVSNIVSIVINQGGNSATTISQARTSNEIDQDSDRVLFKAIHNLGLINTEVTRTETVNTTTAQAFFLHFSR